MFNADPKPLIFGLPPGADFPAQLVQGVLERQAGAPPEAMARVRIYLNTERMRRRVEELFIAQGAGFLPRLLLLTDVAQDPALAGLPAAVPKLRRRLQLSQAISSLIDAQPNLAPRAALFDLSDSLATLMDEMQGEGVTPQTIAALDVSNHSEHWLRTQTFLNIILPYFSDTSAPDVETRQRLAVSRLAKVWELNPPQDPVIIAGSTGSRGTTLAFMQLVAQLPNGALVLPGFDFDMPQHVWDSMSNVLTAEDHPQFRFRKLMDALNLSPRDVVLWREAATPPSPARNLLISLSLRPAPVTDQWLSEGPHLPDLMEATKDITLIEAPSARTEALAIALILRKAAEDGTRAALISPDRGLTRQVTAALDRWGILPDDSAGRPLALSAPGRLLRQVAALFGRKLTSDRLLALLKHPLTCSGEGRGNHLRFTRDLELKLRRYGPAFPSGDEIVLWASAQKDPQINAWAQYVAQCLQGLDSVAPLPLGQLIDRHIALTEALARGLAQTGAGGLWDKEAGIAAQKAVAELQSEAEHGGDLTPFEYFDLFESVLARGEVRETVQVHPNIMIWGTLEARVQGADLVILGGLNDGIWPKSPAPDPWLNRQMRKDAGLLLPERQIGLSAHDFEQAVAAPRVIISHAKRDAEAETVASRWLNRLMNLLQGLPETQGPAALRAMIDRGDAWVALAAALEKPTPAQLGDPRLLPAARPAPCPPVSARPQKMSLTAISSLIRDPYKIYAKSILRLYKLDPLWAEPDARERGIVFHAILERFVKTRPENEPRDAAKARLLAIAAAVLAETVAFPTARVLWLARLTKVADHFLTQDQKHGGVALAVEEKGGISLTNLPFTLFGTPDRIDRLPDGRLMLMDYKTGTPPTEKQQQLYDKQLLLAAIMAERGGFETLGPSEVALISYIGLGSGEKVQETAITEKLLEEQWSRLHVLIGRYFKRETGYAARRALFESKFEGDYDHLSRFGEWGMSDRAKPELVGGDTE